MDRSVTAIHIFISTLLRIFYVMSRHFSAPTFAKVSTDSELTVQADISRCGKECEVMKLRSVGI